jgi:hypothetical protein
MKKCRTKTCRRRVVGEFRVYGYCRACLRRMTRAA